MKTLRERVKEFTVPKATFALGCPNNHTITFKHADEFRPRKDGDRIYSILAMHHRAEFQAKLQRYVVNHEMIALAARDEIIHELKSLFEQLSPLRNPRQGKTYRWLNYECRRNDTIMEGLTLVWDYAMEHKDNMSDHKENILELLEQIRSRHEALDPQAN